MLSSLLTASGGLAIPKGRVARGRVQLPPSKSITQRVLNLALLAERPIHINRPLLADDTRLFLAALESLGFRCLIQHEGLRLDPGERPPGSQIWCGENGTMLRFLTASLSAMPGEWALDGSERLRQRPIGPLVEALRALGARIRYQDKEGFAPIAIEGNSLRGGATELDASLSSQFVSAILMAATRAEEEVVLRVRALVSKPYLQLTRDILAHFGADSVADDETGVYRVRPGVLERDHFEVEGDFSAAAYPAAAAVLTQGQVAVQGVGRDSQQGDRQFLEVLESMGAVLKWRDHGFEIGGGASLSGVDVDFSHLPDQVPTLAVVAPFAAGKTTIRNVRHLRIKESDRLSVMVQELHRLGATIQQTADGLEIEGCWADRSRVPTGEVRVETHGDHRVAMSLAVCGLARPGVIVGAPEVVAKSYPGFWKDLDRLIRE